LYQITSVQERRKARAIVTIGKAVNFTTYKQTDKQQLHVQSVSKFVSVKPAEPENQTPAHGDRRRGADPVPGRTGGEVRVGAGAQAARLRGRGRGAGPSARQDDRRPRDAGRDESQTDGRVQRAD